MKTLLTILFIGVITVKGQLGDNNYGSGFYDNGGIFHYRDNIIYPHYELQPKYDTVKVKILYEQGESIVPMILKAWQVRQFNKWIHGDSVFRDAYSYHEELNKWEPLQIFLFDDKRTLMDTTRIWKVKNISW